MNDRTEGPSESAGSSNAANPTAKQAALIRRLLRERAIPEGVAVDAAGIERMSRREASALIDILLAQPKADVIGPDADPTVATPDGPGPDPARGTASNHQNEPTAKQVALLERLLVERAIPDGVAVDPTGIERISRREASALIDIMLAQPKVDSIGGNSGQAVAESEAPIGRGPSPKQAALLKQLLVERVHPVGFALEPGDVESLTPKEASDAIAVLMAQEKDESVDPIAVARSPNTPPGALSGLAGHWQEGVRYAAAGNPNTPADALAELAKDPGSQWKYSRFLGFSDYVPIRSKVAENPSAPVSVLSALAGDADVKVRHAVAANPSTPVAALSALAADRQRAVRGAVAGHASALEDLLSHLAGDRSIEVRAAVASNVRTPTDALSLLAWDPDVSIRVAVAGNPSAPQNALAHLAGDSDVEVRQAVHGNPGASDEVRVIAALLGVQ